MSKRNSVGQSNTLFNYFQSPKNKTTPKKSENSTDSNPNLNGKENGDSAKKFCPTPKTPKSSTKIDAKKSDVDSDEEVIVLKKKRRRILTVDSDSGSENESPNKPTPKRIKKQESSSSSDDDCSQKEKEKSLKSFSFSKSNGGSTPSEKKQIEKKIDAATAAKKSNNSDNTSTVTDIHSNWVHNRIEFLQPDKIRDIKKRRPDHPDYDWRTVYIPYDFFQKQTPAMYQWWKLKSTHMDSVLFFKVGKFYELYHMDAVVGVKHLGFSYMKGDFAHSGFPETAYAKMAGALIEKGFKVARVEQTETPEMMVERWKAQRKNSKFDRVVKREICQITTKATCVYSAQMPDAKSSMPCYMYAVSQESLPLGHTRFGICFVDTSIGTFHMSEFTDDKHCSKMLALFSEHPPGLILLEKAKSKTYFSELVNNHFKDVRRDTLASKTQFYDASTTLLELLDGCYFKDKEGEFHWPPIFKELAYESFPKKDYHLTLQALGACMWYLKDSEIDIQVLSMGKFEMYKPMGLSKMDSKQTRDYMVLDAVTMKNLNLLGGPGTLQKNLDHCETFFGKRLLKQWICRPLFDIEKIAERQKAVKELLENTNMLKATQDVLKKLPDLERQVAKIHTYGNRFCAQSHPDSRAIFYEAKTYSKRKINDLLKTLKGFEKVQEIPNLFEGCESRLLRKITQHPPKGMFLDLSETLQFFKEAFDQNEAEKEGKIIPKVGVDQEYDDIEDQIAEINTELGAYLEEQSRFFGCKVCYFGTDKKRFQLEVPENKAGKATHEHQLEGVRKGAKPMKRYSTPTSRELLAKMLKAESERAKIVQDLNRRIFEKFSERHDEWEQVTQCLMILDVLCSLAEYARTFSQDICVPTIKPSEEKPKIVIENGRHPCIPNIDSFVPNDTKMGVDGQANIIILTGPNMGGKSTLMRQVAVICVMAQMGSYVPAASCELTLIDRIFTRLGAHDDIVQGQSTFFVELSEAACVLEHATRNSLVLMDELGRGTSTHDGNAIATAYVKKLTRINCRTIFSTHYHSLVDQFINRDDIQLGHMACMVENDEDPTNESVTFLYKMVEGRCPKSYGFNAARLAGLNHSIVLKGREIAALLEQENKNRSVFIQIFASNSVENIRQLSYLV